MTRYTTFVESLFDTAHISPQALLRCIAARTVNIYVLPEELPSGFLGKRFETLSVKPPSALPTEQRRKRARQLFVGEDDVKRE